MLLLQFYKIASEIFPKLQQPSFWHSKNTYIKGSRRRFQEKVRWNVSWINESRCGKEWEVKLWPVRNMPGGSAPHEWPTVNFQNDKPSLFRPPFIVYLPRKHWNGRCEDDRGNLGEIQKKSKTGWGFRNVWLHRFHEVSKHSFHCTRL